MKLSRLSELVKMAGITEHRFDYGTLSRFEYEGLIFETYDTYKRNFPALLKIYTKQPNGEIFIILWEAGLENWCVEDHMEIGAWCYPMFKAFQYLERLDKIRKEEKAAKEKAHRDSVHQWFLENNKE